MITQLRKVTGGRSIKLNVEGRHLNRSAEDDRRALEMNVERSMKAMLNLLSPAIESGEHDDAMIQLGASAALFVEPLSKHEVQALACALYMENERQALSYHDVLRLTDRFSGKAMNITMVYKTIERLLDRGFLTQVEGEADRSRRYQIHGQGREAFRMAVLNSRILASTPSPAAA